MELEHIISDCVNGNSNAQKEIYERFAPRMFSVCIKYSKNRADAEDFLHDGFIKIFEKIGQFQHKGSFEGWIRRIMVNNILEHFRKNSKYYFEDEEKIPSVSEDIIIEIDNPNEKQLSYQEILEYIDKLPERYKMVFNLYVLEGYSHKEISEEMDISIGTSKSNLSRARQWLKDYISKNIKVAII